ncbi:MAG: RecX family transcriptional regulator [Candidatus Levybacteria bacterium]|nr:RecX family transcriptional regulator [Candidatus Levybacteria bacterium]MBI3069941.1 RecX family transcriptional regulator [Candidatus Levybacteria bacterium]MBI3092997.1 RecX family transcriptional regulator [Candidatus Levybacteria bacterium]
MGEFEKFYNKALRFLSYRPRSEKEIRDRLKLKVQSSKFKVEENIIDKVIEKLKEQKFTNDEEFTRWWIEQRTNVQPRSMRLIKIELRQKGISNEIIESRIKNQESGRDDAELVKKLIEKRLSKYKGLEKRELYQKLGRFLASKGFDWETIKKSIDEVVKKGV